MRGTTFAMTFAMVLPFTLIGTNIEVSAKDNTAAIIGGLIIGAAVGAAVSSAVQHPKTIYVPVQAPPPPPPAWNSAFSPAAGVICYPAQQACYRDGGAYAPAWTYKIYAR